MNYFIYEESCTGVIKSQALDTLSHINREFDINCKLYVLLPLKDFKNSAKKYRQNFQNVCLIPLIFGSRRVRLYVPIMAFLSFFNDDKVWFGRGARAAFLLISVRKFFKTQKIIFDGRGAHAAEVEEYFAKKYNFSNEDIENEKYYEKIAVSNADFRIAVSNKLIAYWRATYMYNKNKHLVIPCTLNSDLLIKMSFSSYNKNIRQSYGFKEDDIVLVYSGSIAEWQSFKKLDFFLMKLMSKQHNIKVLFLAKIDLNDLQVFKYYPSRISKDWLDHKSVYSVLTVCDYGLLIRNKTVTNYVASPVKFAEYLSAGLKVILDGEVGDYNELLLSKNLGFFTENTYSEKLIRLSKEEREKVVLFAKKYFSKESYYNSYKQLVEL